MMKKKLYVSLTLLILCTILLTTFVAAFRLSYATDCIAKDCGMIVSGLKGKDIVFCETHFKQALCITHFETVTVVSLPEKSDGILKLDGVQVTAGQSVSRANIGKLRFTPASELTEGAKFTFTCDNCCGGAELLCTLRFADKLNEAPTVSGVSDASLNVWTQKNITVFGSMAATDPENDELTYIVVSYPKRGTLTVVDSAYGDFRYTPRENFRGKDSFSYVARDSYGNYSEVATIDIRVKGNVIDITYDDMGDNSAYNAALQMEAAHIMQGSIEGDGYYFHPEKSVSKSEFVVMAMKALGIESNESLTSTFFDDNDLIRDTEMSYIATAQQKGFIIGDFTGKELLFSPNDAITRAEAAVILTRMMGVTAGEAKAVFADAASIPIWAQEAVCTLYSLGIYTRTSSGNISASAPLTRGQTAYALASASEILTN